ncbi:MAG: DUF4351 domain-containing protein [Gammaproteobacteria bacterium]|nr:DUF4351 domain-containing protein [Gammaproteobacteria bacterium]MDE0366442.1 DUF4351 domain-containing protein [Gammaproteobacteria bacterium]
MARVNLPNMQKPRNHKVETCEDAVRGVPAQERVSDRVARYIEWIDFYADLTDDEFQQYQQQYPEDSSIVAGVISRAREEAMQQGRVEGKRALLERLLRRRFGLLSPEIVEKLGQAAADDLESWADKVLDAATLDDVFA